MIVTLPPLIPTCLPHLVSSKRRRQDDSFKRGKGRPKIGKKGGERDGLRIYLLRVGRGGGFPQHTAQRDTDREREKEKKALLARESFVVFTPRGEAEKKEERAAQCRGYERRKGRRGSERTVSYFWTNTPRE